MNLNYQTQAVRLSKLLLGHANRNGGRSKAMTLLNRERAALWLVVKRTTIRLYPLGYSKYGQVGRWQIEMQEVEI